MAGGFGTRLGHLTRATPKPLLPVAGRPFLDILIAELHRQGVNHIVIIAGFCGEMIAEHYADQDDITVLIEAVPMGTGGALRLAAHVIDDRFFFLNGDSLLDINLQDLSAHSQSAPATLALRWMPDVDRYGEVTLDKTGTVTRFVQRSERHGRGLINGGVGYFSREILDFISPEGEISIEKDVYPRLVERRLLKGRAYDRPFIDIGVPEDYALAQTKVMALLRRGAVIFDRDGVLNHDIAYAHRPDQIQWIDDAIAAVKHVNDAGLLALIATNQAGVAHGYYSEADVHSLHQWMIQQLHNGGANIDGIAYCPYHPAGAVEAYRRVSPMRKPAPGMLLQLMKDYNVDRARTVMIGNADSDMAAAASAGIKGIFFTGGSLLDVVKPVVAQLVADASE
nr:HAD-IIIA family hydrolase [Komagataeibacter sp. FNDCR2]